MAPSLRSRKTNAIHGLGSILALVVLGTPTQSQTALPDEMKSAFEAHGTVATVLRPDPGSVEDPRARVRFRTQERKVLLEWTFGIPGTATGLGMLDNGWRFDELSVGYEPTALCAAAGSATSFFVAGWVERLGAILIEQFDVSNMAVGTTYSPGGEPISTLSLIYERSVVLARTGIGPVRALAFHKSRNELWLLEDSPQHRLMALDVANGSTTEVANATALPELAQMHSALQFVVPPSAPHPGFFVILRPQFDWELVDVEVVDPQSTVCLFRDENLDGNLDVSASMTWADAMGQVDLDLADWWYQ